jgi:peptidoglycan/LPS O-acetylase OafA/YrhL
MSTSGAAGSARHYATLDGFLDFAAISVLVYRLGRWLRTPISATNSWLGVDLFFSRKDLSFRWPTNGNSPS